MSQQQLTLTSATDVAYDEPRTATVWISYSNTWQRINDPIFHRISDIVHRPSTTEGDKTRRGWDTKTDCGATVQSTSWIEGPNRWETSDYRSSDYGMRLPIRWAMQFARPCRRCWP